ncbi:MAG: 5'-deoxynucleotidase [Clostridia bacterium]|nr:5'-deoxynucleotidase [Clostridia bacterium]
MENSFFALMFRMKYIDRWSLMRSNIAENLSEHSLEVAIIAHALAVIGNTYLSKNYNAELIALKAIYHDAPEILTGDMPTPVKYYNDEIRTAYKAVEKTATDRIISLLPEEMKQTYTDVFNLTQEEKTLIKAGDKLCAYIKCMNEIKSGNPEFKAATRSTEQSLEKLNCPELVIFKEKFLKSFFEPIDNLHL